jgi:outer membrane protein assembly factor BamD
VLTALLVSAGCSMFGGDDEEFVDPDADSRRMYERASSSMESGNWPIAIRYFENLQAFFPFSDYSRQAQLDLMYAYYRNDQGEQAIEEAQVFRRENPTHPRVDYTYYIEGLVNFERERGPMERFFRIDLAKRPSGDLMRSFNAFSQLVQTYPDSPYAPDARQRMVYLRNRLAEYEIWVADYYVRRTAFVAAANRAKFVLETYQETPSVVPALQLLVRCYDELGLTELSGDAMRVLEENYPNEAVAYGSEPGARGWAWLPWKR